MKSFEHRCHVIEIAALLSSWKIRPEEIDREIANYGQDGFRLVSVIPVSDGSVGTTRIALFFEREASSPKKT